MFALTLEKIPSVVDRIDMDIEMVNSSFNMNGTFPGRTGSYVFVSNQYRQQVKDSITLTYVTLPTVAGDSSTFLTTFYLVNGPKQPITLPKYVLKSKYHYQGDGYYRPGSAGKYLESECEFPDRCRCRMECGSGTTDYDLNAR